ncbi:CatA-like O-acetyltransferase [Chloroflexota bacterium]
MRVIDLENWSRREHFALFSGMDYPYFGICANVDLTAFYPAIKQRDVSFTVAIVYVLARVANAIPEFQYRIRGDEVVEHEVVHPCTTLLVDEDVFTFCTFDYAEDFAVFNTHATVQIAHVKKHPSLDVGGGLDHWLFMTSIPWISFTGFIHPIHLSPVDSVPRLAWGKFFKDGERLQLPLNIQAHHALIDGVHVGRFYELVQDYLHHPDKLLDTI